MKLLSFILFFFVTSVARNTYSQSFDETDPTRHKTENGILINHALYNLEYRDDAVLLTNVNGENLLRASSILPLEKVFYTESEEGELLEEHYELTNYVFVQENFGSYIYCITQQKMVSPLLGTDATIEVVAYHTDYETYQDVIIQYTSNGKQGFYSSQINTFSEAKYTGLTYNESLLHAFANSPTDPLKLILIDMKSPNTIIIAAEEITDSDNYSIETEVDSEENSEVDYWVNQPMYDIEFYMLRNGDKYGVISKDFSFIVEPEFESISPSSMPYVLQVKQNGKYGLIDFAHSKVVITEFQDLPILSNSEYPPYFFANAIGGNSKIGMDGRNYPMDYYYQHAGLKDEESATSSEWGIKFCDYNATVLEFHPVVGATHIEESNGENSFYYYHVKNKVGMCNTFGEPIMAPTFGKIYDEVYVGNEYNYYLLALIINLKKKQGFYFPKSNRIIEPSFSDIYGVYSYLNSDLIGWQVTRKKKRGFINTEGITVFPCEYSYIDQTELTLNRKISLLTLKTKKGLEGLGNIEGDILIEPIYKNLNFYELDVMDTNSIFYSGISDKKTYCGYIGNESIVELSDPYEFENGMDLLYLTHSVLDRKMDKLGLISLENEQIFPFEFDEIYLDQEFVYSNYVIVIGIKEEKQFPLIYSKIEQKWMSKELIEYDEVKNGKGFNYSSDSESVTDLFTGKKL